MECLHTEMNILINGMCTYENSSDLSNASHKSDIFWSTKIWKLMNFFTHKVTTLNNGNISRGVESFIVENHFSILGHGK